MGRRGKNLEPRDAEDSEYKKFTECLLIEGGTLARFQYVRALSSTDHLFMVYTPTARMLERQCDGCVKKHIPGTATCSATFNKRSKYTEGLYKFDGGEPLRVEYTRERTRGIEECIVNFARPIAFG